MKAYVCDRCGKVMILEPPCFPPKDVYVLSGNDETLCLDLCEECAKNLTVALRKEIGEE